MIKDDIHVKVLKVFQVLSLVSWGMRREMLSSQLEVNIKKIFLAATAALEVQMSVCLCVCVSVTLTKLLQDF